MLASLRTALERVHFDRRIFFFAYVVLGFPYLWLTGPFRAPDERNHFLRSYEISEARSRPYRISEEVVGDDLPASLSRLSEALGIHSEHGLEAAQMSAARALQLQPETREFVEFSTAIYSPLAYVPSAAAIAVGRVFGAGPLALVYFARWANLLVGSWLIACALSSAGYARLPAMLVALFPMTVSQIATVTADAMSFGLGFLWVAMVMETAIASDDVTLKRKVALVLLAAGLSQLRPPYPFLVLLVFLVPIRKFGRYGAVLAGGIAAVSLLLAVAWNMAAAPRYEKPEHGEQVQPRAQLQWIAQHPGPFWQRVVWDLKMHGADYWRQLVGRLGWLNISLPAWIHTGFAVVLICVTFSGRKKPPWPKPWQRVALGVVVLLGVVAIQSALYVTFNPVGSIWILGVQGRYFAILAFAAAFAFSNSLLDDARWNSLITAACLLFAVAAQMGAWLALAHASGKI